MSTARHIRIANRALLRVGAEAIATDEGSSPEQLAIEHLYPSAVESVMGLYRWRFAAKQVELERLAEEPLERFSAAYRLPTGYDYTVDAVYIDGNIAEFERFGTRLHLDATAENVVTAEVRFKPTEDQWPTYFEELVVLKLAAALALTLAEDMQKAGYFEQLATRQFASARTLDSQGRSARKIRMTGLRRYHAGRP